LGSAMPPVPGERCPILEFSCSPIPFNAEHQIRYGNIYGKGRVLGGQPRHCICTNASRGLSATAEFLVVIVMRPFNAAPSIVMKARTVPRVKRDYTGAREHYFGRMSFLTSPMTVMGDIGTRTQVRWVKVTFTQRTWVRVPMSPMTYTAPEPLNRVPQEHCKPPLTQLQPKPNSIRTVIRITAKI